MSETPQLLVGLDPDQAALLLTAIGVAAEPDSTLLERLPENIRAALTRRAEALLALPPAKRLHFAVNELRRRLDDELGEGLAHELARLDARLRRRDQGAMHG